LPRGFFGFCGSPLAIQHLRQHSANGIIIRSSLQCCFKETDRVVESADRERSLRGDEEWGGVGFFSFSDFAPDAERLVETKVRPQDVGEFEQFNARSIWSFGC
jgi:hypothetical protein